MTADLYGESYYRQYMVEHGTMPYERNDHWLSLFRGVASEIVRRLSPTSVLDAGCAIGLLVETLRDHGVQAEGIDVSEYAVSRAPDGVRQHLRAGSLAEELDGRYDLVTCIEVIEHIPAGELHLVLGNLTSVTDQILLSSTPADQEEPTHLNVQPPEFWAARFAEHGFYRDLDFDASFLSPWAVLYRRETPRLSEVVARFERERWQLVTERNTLRQELLKRASAVDVERDEADHDDSEEVDALRHALRAAVDAAHGADARRASVEGRLAHVEYALEIAKAREEETGELIELLYETSGGDARRLHALLEARSFTLYWRLMRPYRWLRGER